MANRIRQSKSGSYKYIIALVIIVSVSALTYGVAKASGWLSSETAHAHHHESREGMVRVPKSLVNLRAFEVVQREDVYSRTMGDDSYFWLPKKQVEAHPEWITKFDQIIGRVMARDKRKEFVFSAKDFLPEGSRSGIAGGIPVGKQGFFLNAKEIDGLRFLKKGDQFDLLARLPTNDDESSSEYGLLMGGIKARGGKPVPLNGVQILVQNGEMIALTTSQSMTTQGGLQLSNKDSRGRAKSLAKDERVAIAIDPAESVPLTRALGEKLEIHMVTRSGQQVESQADDNLLTGRIAFPATAVSIKAFQPIRASDLAEPETSELRQYYFLPADVRDDWIARPNALIGRVVRKPIEPGYIFSEADFLPPESLVTEMKAYETLKPSDLVDGVRSSFRGRVVARDLPAGSKVTEDNLLPPDSLIVDIDAFKAISLTDLVNGRASRLIGRVVARNLTAGSLVTEKDLLQSNSLLRSIKAYEPINPVDLVDGLRSSFTGRIAAQELIAGSILTEKKLLPPGANPGYTSAIPRDRMAMSIDVASVRGAVGLARGDRFDLLSSSTFDVSNTLSGIKVSPLVKAELQSKAVNQVLASDAIVIQASEDKVVIALFPQEVSAVSKSIALERTLFCVARTGLIQTLGEMDTEESPNRHQNHFNDSAKTPTLEKEELTSDPNPLNGISITDTLIGGKRSMQAYLRSP